MIINGLDGAVWAGTARLQPWALGNADTIVDELLTEVARALSPGSKAGQALRRLKEHARTYAAPALGLLPGIGPLVESCLTRIVRAIEREDFAVAFTLALAKTPEIDTSDPDALVVSAAAKIVSIRDRGRPYGPLLMTG